MKHKGDHISGWLVLDKPEGLGSTQAVGQCRHLLRAVKCGHCGTLDPFATGVLPIAFGEATKLVPLVTDGDKEYEFELQFGIATDTLDRDGQITAHGGRIPSGAEVARALTQFVGTIEQTPPVYSAVKINGQRAYRLARQGREVEMPSRRVTIYGLELLSAEGDSVRCRVQCSKGTYIRTLGADIAARLGTWGHLRTLRRTKCGKFDLSHKILLENLKNIEYVEERQKVLLPVITCLRDIAVIAVTEADAGKLRHGQSLSPKACEVADLSGKEAAAVVDGELVAIVRIDERKISPVRVFNFE